MSGQIRWYNIISSSLSSTFSRLTATANPEELKRSSISCSMTSRPQQSDATSVVLCGNPGICQLQPLMLHHHAVWPEFLSCVSHKAVLAEVFQPEQKLLSQIRQLITNILQMALEDKNSRHRTTWQDLPTDQRQRRVLVKRSSMITEDNDVTRGQHCDSRTV